MATNRPKTTKVDSSWMKRSSQLKRDDQANAVTNGRPSSTPAPVNTKDVELKEMKPFPTGTPNKGTNESDKTSLARSSKMGSGRHRRGSEIGRTVGANRLHWLKRNWVLCCLILFGLVGVLVAIIMFAIPCDPIYKEVSQTISLRANTVVNSQSVKCLLDNGVIIGGTCPSGYAPKEVEECAMDTCTDKETGLITTNLAQCNLTSDPVLADACQTDECFKVDVNRLCNASIMCTNRLDSADIKKQECGSQTVTVCQTMLGGADDTVSAHSYAQVNGVCPKIDLCAYCDDTNSGNLYLEYVESQGCSAVKGPNDAVTRKNVVLQPADGNCRSATRKMVTTRTVNVVKTVDVDAMVLLDVSGSVSNPDWDLEVDVAVKVLDTIDTAVKDADVEHKKVGYVVWSDIVWAAQKLTDMKVHKTTVQDELKDLKGDSSATDYGNSPDGINGGCGDYYSCPTRCPSQVISYPDGRTGTAGGCPKITGDRPGLSGTHFTNPLAECADQMLHSAHSSTKTNAYKMCLLITDGENNADEDLCDGGTNLNPNACTDVCGKFTPALSPGTTCTAEGLSWNLKKQTNVSIVAACVKCSDESKKNAYCHSDCNQVDKSIATCKSKLTATGDTLNALLESCTEFVVADDFSTLEAKLVAMTTTLTTSLGTEVVSTTTEQDVTTEEESVAPTRATASQSSSTQNTKTTAPAINRKASVNATDSVDTGTVEEGCQDPGWFWLLLFFLPLLLYLLYYPFKRHYQRKKDRLRELLHERRLLAKMEADEIRAAVAQEQEALNKGGKGGKGGGGGTGGSKKKYKWDIKAADQYLWATSVGGAMKVDFGKMGAPPSAPKGHHKNKELRMSDGRVLKGAEAEKAMAEMEAAEAKAAHEKYEQEIRLAEELERAGKLEEDGDFWLRLCPCCREILIEEGEVDEERMDIEEDLESQKKQERLAKQGKPGHGRGPSLFNDKRAQNASNPAAFIK